MILNKNDIIFYKAFGFGKVDGNLFRIFTRFNPFLKEIEIILLDPNHLLAIRNEYLEKYYLENRNNTISIEQITLDNESLYK